MSKRKFGIYIPSYKRAATISTHDGYIKDDAYYWQKSKQKIGVFV